MSRFRLILIITVLAWASSAVAATPQTFLTLDSQPGDYIGQGMLQTFTPSDGAFTVQTVTNGGVEIYFHTANYSSSWSLFFGPPNGRKLAKGEYEGAQRFAFKAPPKPGMDVSGDGRGCNTLTGRFLVSDVAFALDGTITRLAIDFEQHCEGAVPALYGSVRYNSSVTAVPRLGIGDASTLKGNVGTSDASVIVALSLLSTQLVTVQYATADGSALAGTDYVSTTGTVTFQPGTTSQVINIPIIGDRLARGNKNFFVKLSAASGAPIGDYSAWVKIFDPNISTTALLMSSQPGDYIGLGQLYLFTTADGAFTTSRNFDNGVSVALSALDLWQLDFAGPTNATLTPGSYPNAQRFPFQPAGTPGLSVSGAGRGCNTLTGKFVVKRAAYRTDGSVAGFSADFEQHCEGAVPALFGSIRIASSLRQFSVSDALIQVSSAVFTVTLNPASQSMVSVNFRTADGTALAGTDYQTTTQTVTFVPGELAHTVSVPLLTQPNGQKKFFGQISSPNGAQVWISQGSASF